MNRALDMSETDVSPDDVGDGTELRASDKAAGIVFWGVALLAFPALLYLGRDRWFRYDDWDFLAERKATSLHDLFAPHTVHWSTLPILLYRGVWRTVGLHSYVPYQALSVAAHISVAALLWTLMRRIRVHAWVATAAAALFLFLGSGDEDILWAFGVTFSASIAFGLAHLLLADHDGPLNRRDALGLLAGLLGLLCSGIAVTMVAVVGLATLLRRGWRVAAFHTLPLATAYLVWFFAIGHDGYAEGASSVRSAVSFLSSAGSAAVGRVAQGYGLGWVLAAATVVGCVLAWKGLSVADLRRRAVLPVSMLAGAILFLVITALGRDVESAGATRYTHVTVALALPAIAVAADALIRRYRVALVVFAVMFAVAIVGNIREFNSPIQRRAAEFQQAYRHQLFVEASLPVMSQLPASHRPDTALAPYITIGWLRTAVAEGRIPKRDPTTPEEAARLELGMSLLRAQRIGPAQCVPMRAPSQVTLAPGEALRIPGPVTVVYRNSFGVRPPAAQFTPGAVAPYLVALAGPLDLRVVDVKPSGEFMKCEPKTG